MCHDYDYEEKMIYLVVDSKYKFNVFSKFSEIRPHEENLQVKNIH